MPFLQKRETKNLSKKIKLGESFYNSEGSKDVGTSIFDAFVCDDPWCAYQIGEKSLGTETELGLSVHFICNMLQVVKTKG